MKYTLLILTSILFLGCNKSDDDLNNFYTISKVTKEWYYYKAGSFWVYQDSVLNKTDTLLIINNVCNKLYHHQNSPQDSDYYYEQCNIYFNNNFLGIKTDSIISQGIMTRKFSNGSEHVFFGTNTFLVNLWSPYENSNGEENGRTENLKYYENFTVLENNYPNVREIKITDYFSNKTFYYYFSRNYGMIKIKVDSLGVLNTWKVKHWEIKQ